MTSFSDALGEFVHEASGHKYILYEKLTRAEALSIKRRIRDFHELQREHSRATNQQERNILHEQMVSLDSELHSIMGLVLRRCLLLKPEEYDNMELPEALALFTAILDYCSKEEDRR